MNSNHIIMMFPRTFREVALVLLSCSIFAFLTFMLNPSWTELAVSATIGIILGACGVVMSGILSSYEEHPVDIWRLQRKLMAMSGQKTPLTPGFTKDVILYGALTLEEVGETIGEMHKIMQWNSHSDPARQELMRFLHVVSLECHARSIQIRTRIKAADDFSINLSLDQAHGLLDGVTDCAVTTAGLALSAGLPGAQAYVEVQRSNASKANPLTGMIEKDGSGKWIKGVEYSPPNLDRLLMLHWESAEVNSDHGRL